jgi:hypothetical protein
VAGITDRCNLAGIVMTPDAAFGHDRAGTPRTVGELGAREGFALIVLPPFALDGREVRSSDIRAAIATGDLATAERLLGRPYAVAGDIDAAGRLTFPMPVALPPVGSYLATGPGGVEATLSIEPGRVTVVGIGPGSGRRIEVVGTEAP